MESIQKIPETYTQQEHMGRFAFFRESLRNFKTVGTVTRSSRFLCQAVVKNADLAHAKFVVELGAGDGVMTRHLLNALPSDALLLSFEINEIFCEQMAQIDDHRLIIVNQSAELLPQILKSHGIAQLDAVVSALPFSVFPEDLALNIVKLSHDSLKEKGRFVQIHYSLKTRKLYRQVFGNVETGFEFRNIPPAFVLLCEKTTSRIPENR